MRVDVKSIVGDSALTLEDGQRIYSFIKPYLLKGQRVDLDFYEITLFASLFFNAAIGQLLRDLQPEALNRLLTIENLNASGLETMKRSIANAKMFYASDDFQKVQSEVLRAMAEADQCP